MAKLTITNDVVGLAGEYDLDLESGFTKTEYYLMKKHVGVVAADMLPGAPIDLNVLTAWGIVMLHRAGKDAFIPAFMETNDSQTLWDIPETEASDGEDDALPPPSESVVSTGAGSNLKDSGSPTENGSVNPASVQSPIGSLLSATTSDSDLAT